MKKKIDILSMAEQNNNFVGTVKDLDKETQLHDLQLNAMKFKRFQDKDTICDVRFEDEENTHRNCSVYIDMPTPLFMSSESVRLALSEMIAGCDNFCIVSSNRHYEKGVRMSFGVRDLWK